MFAFISNEYHGIVYSKDQLRLLSSVYSYPKVQYCKTEKECLDFIARNKRSYNKRRKKLFGWVETTAYIRIEYFISDHTIFANLYTDHFGFVVLNITEPNVIQSASYDLIKLKISNVNVMDNSITSHCVAIQYILHLLSSIINVQIIVPDISVYLALTEYTGRNAAIQRSKHLLSNRLGKVVLLLQ